MSTALLVLLYLAFLITLGRSAAPARPRSATSPTLTTLLAELLADVLHGLRELAAIGERLHQTRPNGKRKSEFGRGWGGRRHRSDACRGR